MVIGRGKRKGKDHGEAKKTPPVDLSVTGNYIATDRTFDSSRRRRRRKSPIRSRNGNQTMIDWI